MLEKLHIENLAVVETATLEFGSGLNVLTGSTGAGKSLIVGGVNLLLGEKAARSAIRAGAERAVVEAVFRIGDPATLGIAGEFVTGGTLGVRREVSRTGRGGAWIGERPVPVKQLATVVRSLIEPHGQNEQLRLKDADSHVWFLDAYGGITTTRVKYERRLEAYRAALAELHAFESRIDALREKQELLLHRIEELDRVGPKEGERDELSAAVRVMENAEKIYATLGEAVESVYDADDSAVSTASSAIAALGRIRGIDPELDTIATELESSVVGLRECADAMRRFLSRIDFDPAALSAKRERLDVLLSLEHRYRMSTDELVGAREAWKSELDGLAFEDEERARLESRVEDERAALSDAGMTLSRKRSAAAKRMSEEMSEELGDLMMKGAVFRTDVSHVFQEDGDARVGGRAVVAFYHGIDRVRFVVRTNPGEAEGPLEDVASTGELSRIALAVKRLTVGATGGATLVFDEIDAGVGGDLGDVISEKLLDLSRRYQIVCITHMPQIAARGHRHFVVEKHSEKGRTAVRVMDVSGRSRQREVARMLGGADGSDRRMALAAELLDCARPRTDSRGVRP